MFKTGDKVICIDSFGQEERLKLKEIYTVKCLQGDIPEDYIELEEINYTFSVGRFEPYVKATKFDVVEKPSHYNQGKIQPLDFIEDQKLGLHESQVVKYVVRAKHKGNELQDLKKALFYLNRKIKILTDETPDNT